ncbi:hypothetical protein AGMMS49936_11310 [Endomicrobiia bacterium]|nr:hypothetical protein AGMMS49936_11310 [Endomicrobiia bacterium]
MMMDVLDIIEQNYITKINLKGLFIDFIKGVFDARKDIYSCYMGKKSMKN